MGSSRRIPAAVLLAWIAGGCSGSGDTADRLRVAAAASLVEVAGELASAFESREGVIVELNIAGSNTLAQQILAAPGVDVFLSADAQWIEVLERAGRVDPDSRRALLGNRLVLIANSASDLRLERPEELAATEFSHLALADPEAVPAGRYAKAALLQIELDGGSLWQAVAPRVAPTLDVRAARALVESDSRIIGVVYETDARQSRRVRVLYEFPASDGARVNYWGALVAGSPRPWLGRRFLDFLAGPEGRRIADRHGFGAPPS